MLLLGVFFSDRFDRSLYVFFKGFGADQEGVYLKDFFVSITILGDSFWYFAICLLGIFVIFGIEKLQIKKITNLTNIKKFIYFSFFAFLITGLLTQILKHVFGRTRPNHLGVGEALSFDFFTLDSNLHSFPSGHTSMIFILAILFAAVAPKLKYIFYMFAFVVGFSRVVVGAHFFTDVLGGIVVAFISYKLCLLFYNYKFNQNDLGAHIKLNEGWFFSFVVVAILILIFLTFGPSFDLFFSDLFYKGDNQFVLQSFYFSVILVREILLIFIIFYILLLPLVSSFIPLKIIYFGHKFNFKEFIFIWAAAVLHTILIHLLKNLWGRARPNETLQFGGGDNFSPWYVVSEACTSNCSFVSGDSAVGFSLILLYFVSKNLIYLFLSVCLGLLFGLVRVAEGAHFLSDVVFSGLIVFLFALLMSGLIKKRVL